jgi:predicted DNA-binding transcriptional regulator AlpA
MEAMTFGAELVKAVRAAANAPLLVGVSDAAQLLGVSESTFDRWRLRGDFPKHIASLGGNPRWRRKDIENWLAELK